MSQGLREDINGGKIQGFAPKEIITVTATVAWTPTKGTDRAFRVGVASTYYMDALSTKSANLLAGSITVLNKDINSLTFDTTQNIEVM